MVDGHPGHKGGIKRPIQGCGSRAGPYSQSASGHSDLNYSLRNSCQPTAKIITEKRSYDFKRMGATLVTKLLLVAALLLGLCHQMAANPEAWDECYERMLMHVIAPTWHSMFRCHAILEDRKRLALVMKLKQLGVIHLEHGGWVVQHVKLLKYLGVDN